MRNFVSLLLFVLDVLRCCQPALSDEFSESTNFTVFALISNSRRLEARIVFTAARYLEITDLKKANIDLGLFYLPRDCDRRIPVKVLVNHIYNYRRSFSNIGSTIHGIVVDDCEKVCSDVSTLAAVHQISVMSYGCESPTLNRPSGFRNLVRSISSVNYYPMLMHIIADDRKWSRVVLYQREVAEEFDIGEEDENMGQKVDFKIASISEDDTYFRVANLSKEITRVIGLNLDSDLRTMQFLTAAKELGMYNGEYAYITTEFDPISRNDVLNSSVVNYDREAVRKVVDELDFLQNGLLSIDLKKVPMARIHQIHNKLAALPKMKGADDIYTLTIDDDVSGASYAFEALMIWGKGIKHAAEQTHPKYSLQELFGSLPKTTKATSDIVTPPPFESVTGRVAVRKEEGDCNVSFSLIMIQNGRMQIIGDFGRNLSDGKKRDPTILFRLDATINSSVQLVWPGGSLVQPVGYPVPCGWDDDICKENVRNIILAGVLVGLAFICLIVMGIICIHSRITTLKNELLQIDAWTIKYKDLSFEITEENRNSSNTTPVDPSTVSPTSTEEIAVTDKKVTSPRLTGGRDRDKVAMYRNMQVHVHHISKKSVNYTDRRILLEIKQMRNMNHENLVMFIGVCVEAPHVSIVMASASHGSLHHVMIEKSMDLDLEFTSAFLLDVAEGMHYLHSSDIGSHGNLSSLTCVIDHRWNCKVTGYGLAHFRELATAAKQQQNLDDHPFLSRESKLVRKYPFWMAPELMRKPKQFRPLNGTKKGDVYSFAIVVQEVLINQIPFGIDLEMFTAYEIMDKVKSKKKPPFRPTVPPATCDKDWVSLMNDAWDEDPSKRPSFRAIIKRIKRMGGKVSDNMIEKLMTMLELYASHLEELVHQRTQQADAERERAAQLLYSILPPIVADGLKHGKTISAENFKSITMFASDIVGFTKLSVASTPLQIVELLGQLYLEFDSIVDRHDAYKVETIGDAYIIASGLPIPNESKHALEIADIALEVLSYSFSFVIPHLPEKPLQIRIGIHTGPVVTGVVGVKMPRYCLFGETVTIATKMESNSVANYIHVSQTAAEILQETDTYQLYSRGVFQLKGKEPMETFFLLGKTGLTIPLPTFTPEEFPITTASGH